MLVFFSPAKSVSNAAIGKSAASAIGFSRQTSQRHTCRNPANPPMASNTDNVTTQPKRTAL
jgi:hypothetical protein